MDAKLNAARRPRVLHVSYSCSPNQNSEPAVGWNRALESAKYCDTWVICADTVDGDKTSHLQDRQRFLRDHGEIPGLKFCVLPHTRIEKWLATRRGGYYLAYNLWHRRAYRFALKLDAQHQFDLVHQVNFCGYREPGYTWKMEIPRVWGPIGGTQDYPWRMLKEAGLRGALSEGTRSIVNQFQLRFLSRVRHAANNSCTIAANSTARKDFERFYGLQLPLFAEAGVNEVERVNRTLDRSELRLLWSGQLDIWKALSLLLKAMANLPNHVDVRLRVIGDGASAKKWKRLAARLRVDDRIVWLGKLVPDDARVHFKWADVLVFTSMRDTTGSALFQAMEVGLPIVCVNHQGAQDIVTDECGIKIPVESPEQVIRDLERTIVSLSNNRHGLQALSDATIERAKALSWTRLGQRINKIYQQALIDGGKKDVSILTNSVDSHTTNAIEPEADVMDTKLGVATTVARTPVRRALRLVSSRSILALADQATVSGTRFLTTVIVGRECGKAALGEYHLAFTLIVLLVCIQESLVTVPYTIFYKRYTGKERRVFAGNVLGHGLVLSLIAFALTAIAAMFIMFWQTADVRVSLVWALAFAIPSALLREFARRFSFADLNMEHALTIDVCTSALQLGGLFVLWQMGALNASTALWTMSIACAMVGIVWFFVKRHEFEADVRQSRKQIVQNWRFGRWIFASQMMTSLSTSVAPWALFWFLGTDVTGVYAACMTVVLISNPFILGIGNFLTPRFANAKQAGGSTEVRRIAWRASMALGSAMLLFVLLSTLFGSAVVSRVYDYSIDTPVIVVLSLAVLATAIGLAADIGLQVLEHPRINVVANVAGLIANVSIVAMLIWSMGILGAAIGWLIGNTVGTIVRCLLFHRISRKSNA